MSNFFEDVQFSPPKPAVLGSVLEELQLTAQGVGQIVMTNETYS
jgi:hypothetical protein